MTRETATDPKAPSWSPPGPSAEDLYIQNCQPYGVSRRIIVKADDIADPFRLDQNGTIRATLLAAGSGHPALTCRLRQGVCHAG